MRGSLRTYQSNPTPLIQETDSGLTSIFFTMSRRNGRLSQRTPIMTSSSPLKTQVRDNVVVTVARGVPEKNLELFWEVAKRFPSHEFVLLLTRDPRFVEYSMALECTAPANGRVIVNPDKEMYQETLSRSKIYLHLMRGEHFGITVVESMSAGCVPVVHDSGGPKEIGRAHV